MKTETEINKQIEIDKLIEKKYGTEISKPIKEAVEIIRPLVEKIEHSVPMTKYHYAKYLEILFRVPKQNRAIFCSILLIAGANKEGVAYAMKIIN